MGRLAITKRIQDRSKRLYLYGNPGHRESDYKSLIRSKKRSSVKRNSLAKHFRELRNNPSDKYYQGVRRTIGY